ncbi:MAG: type VI secretion system lipoprotein TssJ [Helicobacteraceae bacterium]|nr:type VI secretion system lipoprotein TssJ [Helicobacteraceae bacterium]
MINSKYLIFLLSTLFLIGCGAKPEPVDGSNEKFALNAISINYTSNKKLNMYENQSHVVPLVVYQLNNINSFNNLKKDNAGIIKLLEGKQFDKSVMNVDKFYISPNETKQLPINRATSTVWVALVAGFYDMNAAQSTLEYQIPDTSMLKFWQSDESQKFLPIDVYFENSSIQKSEQ